MGLTEQLHRIIAEFGHLLPGQHVKTLQEAGDALAMEPDSETPNPRYVPPGDDEALLSSSTEASTATPPPDPIDPSTPAPSIGDEGKAADPTTTTPTPSTSSEGSSGASSTP